MGSDAEGSELRARMQSASLLSDMESFKAANPGAVLGDFVRWYSPRDWIDGEKAGDKVGQYAVDLHCGASTQSRCFVMFSCGGSGYQLVCSVAAVSAQPSGQRNMSK